LSDIQNKVSAVLSKGLKFNVKSFKQLNKCVSFMLKMFPRITFEKVFCPLKVIFGIFEGIFLRIIVTPRQACDMQADIVAIPGENDSFLFWPKAVLLGVLSVLETG
jgi:hypothetical protein